MWAEEKFEVLPALVELVDDALPAASLVLEAGCGHAGLVAQLERDDRAIVGVDLARDALAAARAGDPTLRLAVADVARMPFADAAFDGVLSLGVVEHFGEGPVRLLAEHGRVLAPDGVLVLTVPHRGWWRAATDTWHLRIRRRASYVQGRRTVVRCRPGTGAGVPGFHQYELTRRQLVAALREAGLEVVRWRAIDVGTGLRDLRRSSPPPEQPRPPDAGAAATAPPGTPAAVRRRGALRGWVHRAVFSAEPVGPIGRLARGATGRAFGHIQIVEARAAAR
jgi:SAM-dependent methyltransferase